MQTNKKRKGKAWLLPFLLIAAGVVIRLRYLHIPSNDIRCFDAWLSAIDKYGFSHIYNQFTGAIDYPPVYLYVLQSSYLALKGVYHAVTAYEQTVITAKLLNVGFDLGVYLLLYNLLKSRVAAISAWLLATLFWFNPYVIFNSAIWGQVDSLIALFVLASLLCLEKNRLVGVYLFLILGMLTKTQTVIVIPLFVLFAIRKYGWKAQVKPLLLGFGVLAMIIFPFIASGTLPELWRSVYATAASRYPFLSLNAYNFWWYQADPYNFASKLDSGKYLFGLTARQWGFILFGLSYLLGLWYLRKSRRGDLLSLVTTISFIFLAFYSLNTQMHERYLYGFFAPWVLVVSRNYKSLGIFLILTVTQYISLRLSVYIPINVRFAVLQTPFFPVLTYILATLNLLALLYIASQMVIERKQVFIALWKKSRLEACFTYIERIIN